MRGCRGAKNADGGQVHLLSAMTHETGLVLAQTDVDTKTNEVPRLKDLLGGLDLRGAILTVDALHTARGTATWLYKQGIDFAMTVKENTPKLFQALDALPWDEVPIGHTSTDRGHGRITTRTVQTLPVPADLPFPHVKQAFLIERSVTDLAGKNLSSVAALAVVSLSQQDADPARVGTLIRGHWAIESMHWIRSQGVPRLLHDVARVARQEACATDLLGCVLVLQSCFSRRVPANRTTCATPVAR